MPRYILDPVPTGSLPPDRPIHQDQRDSYGAIVLEFRNGIPYVLACQGYKGISFPKGRPEPGETPAETAYREVLEETGIAVTVDTAFQTVVPSGRPGDKRTVTFFMGHSADGTKQPIAREVKYAAWIPVDQALRSIKYPPDGQALELALSYCLQSGSCR